MESESLLYIPVKYLKPHSQALIPVFNSFTANQLLKVCTRVTVGFCVRVTFAYLAFYLYSAKAERLLYWQVIRFVLS